VTFDASILTLVFLCRCLQPDPFFEGDVVVPLAHAIDQRAMELSDVITIHAYCDPLCLQTTLMEVSHFGKPMLLTEWMARQVKSTYEQTLPTLKELKVGAYQWGLVRGKTQTHLPWPHGTCEHVTAACDCMSFARPLFSLITTTAQSYCSRQELRRRSHVVA